MSVIDSNPNIYYIYGPLKYSVRVYDQYLKVCQLLIDISGIYIHIYTLCYFS